MSSTNDVPSSSSIGDKIEGHTLSKQEVSEYIQQIKNLPSFGDEETDRLK